MTEIITSARTRTLVVEVMFVVLEIRVRLYGRNGLLCSRSAQKLIVVGI